nr:hypothetical protein RSP673_11920 [Ralstonia solanacearum P673]
MEDLTCMGVFTQSSRHVVQFDATFRLSTR